jgi:hypothetical protein
MSTIQLTPEQLALVGESSVARAIDPASNKTYVLVEERVYEQLRQHLGGDDADAEALYPLLAEVAPEDWEDPSVYGVTLKR